MQLKTIVVASAFAGFVSAQRPSNTSICDYYTTVLFKNNTAENQLAHLTFLVNTVVVGNYTKPTIEGITWPDISVPGILTNGTIDGKIVSLLPYFNGHHASTNSSGRAGAKVSFLDDGGAAPLLENKPSNGNTNSRQHKLLTHLYSFFGALLGCSLQSTDAGAVFPVYAGNPSQHAVHKFMDVSSAEFTYFINTVALAARSFGVADEDVQLVGKTLNDTFGQKCSGDVVVVPGQEAASQAICLGEGCPVREGGVCPRNETGNGTSTSTSTGGAAGATRSAVAGGALAAGLGALAMLL